MNTNHLALAAAMAAVVLGLPFGLYAVLTREQRRNMRCIRAGAAQRGWRYRLQRWQGNPTAFRIDGRTAGGLDWILTSGNTNGYDRGWSVRLVMRFPALAGEPDPELTEMEDRAPQWPPECVAPHSLLAWRDSSAFWLQVRLPATPNWVTVTHAVSLGEGMASRIPK